MDANAFENLDTLFATLRDKGVHPNGVTSPELGEVLPLAGLLDSLDDGGAVAHDETYFSTSVGAMQSPASAVSINSTSP